MAFMFLREAIQAYRERDPAARSSPEVLLCYPGCTPCSGTASPTRSGGAASACLARFTSHLGRFLTGIEIHPAARIGRRADHRPRHGRRDRRDRRGRRRRLPLSPGHARRHQQRARQAAPDGRQRRDRRRRRQDPGRHHWSATAPGSAPTRWWCSRWPPARPWSASRPGRSSATRARSAAAPAAASSPTARPATARWTRWSAPSRRCGPSCWRSRRGCRLQHAALARRRVARWPIWTPTPPSRCGPRRGRRCSRRWTWSATRPASMPPAARARRLLEDARAPSPPGSAPSRTASCSPPAAPRPTRWPSTRSAPGRRRRSSAPPSTTRSAPRRPAPPCCRWTGDGVADLDALERCWPTGPALVCLMLANNETGTIQPVAEAAALCRRHGALLHVDAVQAAGRIPVDLAALGRRQPGAVRRTSWAARRAPARCCWRRGRQHRAADRRRRAGARAARRHAGPAGHRRLRRRGAAPTAAADAARRCATRSSARPSAAGAIVLRRRRTGLPTPPASPCPACAPRRR